MTVERYDKAKHYATVKAWYEAHGEVAPPAASLPQTGFIVPELACGFLYRTDADWAIIEGLVSKPKSDTTARREALNEIVVAILAEAKKLGFRYITYTSDLPPVLDLGRKFGFHLSEQKYVQGIKVL